MNNRGAYQKKALNLENVEARHALLLSGLSASGKLSKPIIQALAGQRAFSALSLPSTKIEPISLNTLKTLANELYSHLADADGDGFGYLDKLRMRLKAQIATTAYSGRSIQAKATKHTEQLDSLTNLLREAELQNIRRSKAYLDLYGKLNTFVKEGSLDESTRLRLFKLLESHHALFGSLFNPHGAQANDDGAVVIAWPSQQEA